MRSQLCLKGKFADGIAKLTKASSGRMDDLLSKPQVLVPLWIERTGNGLLDWTSARPVLIEVEMLHATMRGEMLQLCTTWARVLPSDPFFLWQDTRVSVHFRFRDTLYALSGLTGVSDADDSFRFEFDSVSRQRLQVLSRLLQDAGLLRSSELQTCASRQNDRSAAPPAKHEGPEDAKRDPVKYCSSEHNRRRILDTRWQLQRSSPL